MAISTRPRPRVVTRAALLQAAINAPMDSAAERRALDALAEFDRLNAIARKAARESQS